MYWNNHTMLFKPIFNVVLSPIAVMVSIFGLIGNSLVVWFLSFKIKRNSCTVYIFNLAMADASFMLFLIILLFLALILSLNPQLEACYEDVHVIRIIHALHLASILGYNTSLCFLTAISIERCLSVFFPLWYYCNRPRHLSTGVCTFIWISSCSLSFCEVFFCYNIAYNGKGLVEESSNECRVTFVFICCFSFAVFIPSMTVSSFILLIRICTTSQQQLSMKIYVVITVTVVFFLIFGMPMRILLLVWYKHHIMPPFPTLDVFILFCAVNSTVNPFVYFLVGRQGKRGKFTLLTVFQAVFRDEGSQYRRPLLVSMDFENITTQPPITGTMYWNKHNIIFKPVMNIVISNIAVIVSLFGLIGNSLVVWFLSFKIKRNACTVYIFNLALADASLMLFSIALYFLALVLNLTPQLASRFEDVHVIRIIHALNLACILGYNTSLCFLTAISIERCISVLFPLWYYCNRPRHLSTGVCTFIWITSCILSVLEFFFCSNVDYNARGLVEESRHECRAVFIIICCFSFAVFIPFMTVSSFILLIGVCRTSQQQRSMKIYVVVTVTVIIFLIFGMPMRILLLVWYKHHIMPPFPIMDLFTLFCAINSATNPFVYFLVGRQGNRGEIKLLTVFQAVFRDEGIQYKREQRNITTRETAKTLIPRLWRSEAAPSVESWIGEINHIMEMEELTAAIHETGRQFRQMESSES
ncbi:uncharacterized protein PAF06_009720 [Gastrophryne carolinensis]